MIRAVGYCRFSSENQADGFSIEAQKKAITDFAIKNDYEVLRFYIDEAKSGTTINGREGFLDMLSDSKKGDFSVVLVHKLDRFARNRVDAAVSKKVLKDNGVKLVSVLEYLDDSPESIILESVLEGMNEYYSKNLARESKKGMKIAGQKGRILGTCPYGYTADKDKKFMLVESEAKVVKLIFDRYTSGAPIAVIHRELCAAGYKTKRGNPFTMPGIAALLKNRTYTGDYVFGEDVYEGVAPVIISKAQYEKAQELFKPRIRPKNKGCVYLLTGLVYHSCGAPMTGFKSIKKGTPYFYYRCKNKEPGAFIKKKELEDATINCLLAYLSNDNVIDDVVNSVNKEIKARLKGSSVSKLKSQLNKTKAKQSRLLDIYLSGDLDKENYLIKKDELDLEETRLNNQLSTCLSNVKISRSILKAAFAAYSDKIKNSLTETSSLQTVISKFIKRIIVYADHVDFEFNFETNETVAFKRDYAYPYFSLVATFSIKGSIENFQLSYESTRLSSAL